MTPGTVLDDNAVELQQRVTGILDSLGVVNRVNQLFARQAWQAVSLANSWAAATTVGYMKDPFGFVHLKGSVQAPGAGVNSTVLTLPAGYRPVQTLEFGTKYWNGATNTLGSVNISTAGVVSAFSNANGTPPASVIFYFDHITFRAEG